MGVDLSASTRRPRRWWRKRGTPPRPERRERLRLPV